MCGQEGVQGVRSRATDVIQLPIEINCALRGKDDSSSVFIFYVWFSQVFSRNLHKSSSISILNSDTQ